MYSATAVNQTPASRMCNLFAVCLCWVYVQTCHFLLRRVVWGSLQVNCILAAPCSTFMGYSQPSKKPSDLIHVAVCKPLAALCPVSPAVTQPDPFSPTQTIVWGGTLPNTRRAAIGGATATAIGRCPSIQECPTPHTSCPLYWTPWPAVYSLQPHSLLQPLTLSSLQPLKTQLTPYNLTLCYNCSGQLLGC